MKITTPLLHDDPRQEFSTFFQLCPQCNDPSSNYYINIVSFNAWIGGWAPVSGQVDWIRDITSSLKQTYNRPVWLGYFGRLGGQSADDQLDAINSDVFIPSVSGLDGIYYFAAVDYGGGTKNNFLTSRASNGQTLGQALAQRCSSTSVNS